MLEIGKTYKVDLSLLPNDCAVSNQPRIANNDVVVIVDRDIFSYRFWIKKGIECYVVKVVVSSFPRASKDKGAISKIPECILLPHCIDLAVDKNHIKPSIMYKTKGL